jgi:hypothetical protein
MLPIPNFSFQNEERENATELAVANKELAFKMKKRKSALNNC